MGLFKRKPKATETTVSVHSEAIDASAVPGLGDEILKTLREHGIQPGQNRVVDANSIPGLSEEIMGALDEAGVWQQPFVAKAEHDGPVDQLAKLAKLHKDGVLSDYEFSVAKQKLLDERWEA